MKDINESTQPVFDKISNYIYNKLNLILNNKLEGVKVTEILDNESLEFKLNIQESEEIR